MRTRIALSSLLALPSAPAWAADTAQYQEESRAVVMPFMQQLMAENRTPPSGSARIAPRLAGEVSRKQGWKLTRVSLKVHNPLPGTAEQIPPAVKARLAEDYPHDKATGYAPGQIRGAVSVKRPL